MALSQSDRMSGDVAPAYVRHKPEQTLLYQLVEQYWPEFQAQRNETGRFLPRHVTREFEDYLACGRLENGFLRVRCQSCRHEHVAWAAPLHSAANDVAFALAVVPGAWWRRLRFW